jgi:hypothetical protein
VDLRDAAGAFRFRVRGAFSTTWNPKPYSFETWNEDNADQEVSLLGMPEE